MKRRQTWLATLGLGIGLVGSYLLVRAYRRARASCPPFRRRAYRSARELVEDCRPFWLHPEALRSLRANARIDGPFVAKAMLAVASADGLGRVGALHMRHALRQGLSAEEVHSLAHGDLASATVDEAPALYFARHYAERDGRPDEDMVQRLEATYGRRTARDMLTLLRLLSIARLVGNTLDAFLSRLLGHPSPDTTLRGELSVLLVFALGIVPLIPALAWRMSRTPMPSEPLSDTGD